MNLPLSWPGSKVRLMPRLQPLFPPHKHRIYVFGGAGGEVISTRPPYMETFNDINQDVYGFFHVLQNDVDALCSRLAFVPFSERVFHESRELLLSGEGTQLERAAAFCIVANLSRGASDPSNGRFASWSINYKVHKNTARWQRMEETLRAVSYRFKAIQLCNGWGWEEVLDRFDKPGAFFSLDPPYPKSTLRSATPLYRHSMSEDDHERLLVRLHRLRSPWMLFGFHCPLYDSLLAGNAPLEFRRVSAISPKKKRPMRTECVWFNY